MELLQKKLFYQAKFKSSLLVQSKKRFYNSKNQKGFMSLLLLPLIALMATGIIGLASLSIGIKNITQAQSICIRNNIKGQKNLGNLLQKILNLNEKVLKLHKTRQALQTKLALAISTGQIKLIPTLKKSLSLIQKAQNLLIFKQKYILNQSQFVKEKSFTKFKKTVQQLPVSTMREKSFFKKALAIKKKKVGDKAYTYKPVSNFTEKQKIQFLWDMNPFYPLDISWLEFKHKKNFQYQCATSLTRKGNIWISHLYH